MLQQQFIDAVAAEILRTSHFTNVDAVRVALAKIGTAMAADVPSEDTAALKAHADQTDQSLAEALLELAAAKSEIAALKAPAEDPIPEPEPPTPAEPAT